MGKEEGTPYLVMEFLEGIRLDRVIQSGIILPLPDSISIGIQLARTLDYVHHRGIIHRDLKPSNIICVQDTNTVKIIDFGLASSENLDRTAQAQREYFRGTLQYASPEQILGQSVDARSDLFSVGVILYELLTGKRPFTGETVESLLHEVATVNPKPLGQLAPHLPDSLKQIVDSLQQIVDRTLAKNPSRRFPSGEELAQALERVLVEVKGERVIDKSSSASNSLLHLILEIRRQSETDYLVTALSSYDFSTATSYTKLPVHLLREALQGAKVLDTSAAREIGRVLFTALFGDKTETLYRKLREKVHDLGTKLYIHLILDEQLERLPWELLYDEISCPGQFVALSENVLLSRHAALPPDLWFGSSVENALQSAEPSAVRLADSSTALELMPFVPTIRLNGIKQALILANPMDAPQFDNIQEAHDHQLAMHPFVETENLSIYVDTSVTIQRIRRHPDIQDADIICFIGHGAYQSEHPQAGALLLETPDGQGELVSGQAFVEALGTTLPPMIVLQCCPSAERHEWSALQSVAHDMVLAGIPSVLYLQFPTHPDFLNSFLSEFHRSLVNGQTLEGVLSQARRALAVSGYTPDWAAPALMLPALGRLSIEDLRKRKEEGEAGHRIMPTQLNKELEHKRLEGIGFKSDRNLIDNLWRESYLGRLPESFKSFRDIPPKSYLAFAQETATDDGTRMLQASPASPLQETFMLELFKSEPYTIHRYGHVHFPRTVEKDQWYELKVYILTKPADVSDSEITIEIPPERVEHVVVDVRVVAYGFNIQGNKQASLSVPLQGDTEPIVFHLQPTEVGKKEIKAIFSLQGKYLGMICVFCEVKAASE
jgi:serine/threonine protein kinase